MGNEARLSVNVDHVATLRQARGVDYPSPLEAAAVAEAAGASGITVHLRADRRHIQDDDILGLRGQVLGKLNLELAASDEMIGVAVGIGPHQVTLVPERPEELTTEGGLDLVRRKSSIERAVRALATAGIAVSLFLDPDPRQIRCLAEYPRSLVEGFEINTDAYTRARGDVVAAELAKVRRAASLGAELGLEVFAGHGLAVYNVGPIAAIPEVVELNVGHSIVSRAVLVGMEPAVREMLQAMG